MHSHIIVVAAIVIAYMESAKVMLEMYLTLLVSFHGVQTLKASGTGNMYSPAQAKWSTNTLYIIMRYLQLCSMASVIEIKITTAETQI